MSDLTIVALDPGETTGWAAWHSNGAVGGGECHSLVDVERVLETLRPAVVVIETFRIYPWRAQAQSWSDVPAATVIGVVRLWCQKNGVELVEQSASERKAVPRAWLESLGLWGATRGYPHARDAARHLAAYLARKHPEVIAARVAEVG